MFYMLKSNIDVFFVTSFLCSFLFFHRIEYPKRCLWQKIEIFLRLSFCDIKKQCTVLTLTIDLWRSMFFQWIEYHPINILHQFQIDISSNRDISHSRIRRISWPRISWARICRIDGEPHYFICDISYAFIYNKKWNILTKICIADKYWTI